MKLSRDLLSDQSKLKQVTISFWQHKGLANHYNDKVDCVGRIGLGVPKDTCNTYSQAYRSSEYSFINMKAMLNG